MISSIRDAKNSIRPNRTKYFLNILWFQSIKTKWSFSSFNLIMLSKSTKAFSGSMINPPQWHYIGRTELTILYIAKYMMGVLSHILLQGWPTCNMCATSGMGSLCGTLQQTNGPLHFQYTHLKHTHTTSSYRAGTPVQAAHQGSALTHGTLNKCHWTQ